MVDMEEFFKSFRDYFFNNPVNYTIVGVTIFVIALICVSFYVERRNKAYWPEKTTFSDYALETLISALLGGFWPFIIIILGVSLVSLVPIWIGKRIFFFKNKMENKKIK